MNQYENIDELIAKCVAEEASESEKEIVNMWIAASAMNGEYYSDIKMIYEAAEEKTIHKKIDVSMAWEKFSEKLIEPQGTKTILRRLVTSFYSKVAILVLIVVIGYFSMNQQEKEIVFTSSSSHMNDTLPDGTFVSLNPRSNIVYSSSFNSKNRKLKLTGQAYFHVQHNRELPFIVQTENVFIKDIGTSFTIKAQPSDSIVTVYVEEGEVNFYSAQSTGMKLIKNETGIYNKIAATFQKKEDAGLDSQLNKNITLSFENTRLEFVIDTLNKVYNQHIILSCKDIKSLELTATFKETTINPIIETIAETFGLSIVKVNGIISLNGEACKE